jgi:hypothetical protein
MKKFERPPNLCMAPWTHTYLSPQTERRMCCASREPAQNFEQYIDTATGTGVYVPMTLVDHWNSDHMRSVRRRMMAGETLPECEVCNDKLLNTSVYRDYFNSLFGHRYEQAMSNTLENGVTFEQPVSWDYRFSNYCNFKCRTCGDMLSSAWEVEQRVHNMIDWNNPKNAWLRPEVRKQIFEFQTSQIEQEFSDAVEQHRVEEVYWVGGEPLMYEQHWNYMRRIIELGDGPKVYARYNSNLSRIVHGQTHTHLFRDILSQLRDWQMCASLDGTGTIGEYIRTGLRYTEWLDNFREGLRYAHNARNMRIDFTLTLPGMFEVGRIQQLANELGVEILAKVIFSFSPDIVMSPLALPRHLLNPWLDEIVADLPNGALRDVLLNLKSRPTFEEQWPDTYQQGLRKGKARIHTLENIRTAGTDMAQILGNRPAVLQWWNQIENTSSST